MLERCETPLCPPTTNMKPSMTPTPKLILLSAMGATISQASLLGSYRSTLCGADEERLIKFHRNAVKRPCYVYKKVLFVSEVAPQVMSLLHLVQSCTDTLIFIHIGIISGHQLFRWCDHIHLE